LLGKKKRERERKEGGREGKKERERERKKERGTKISLPSFSSHEIDFKGQLSHYRLEFYQLMC